MKRRAVFFDRDGVINERILGGYVKSWDEFRWLPDVGETLQEVKAKKYLAIIISNQRGVGLGLMTYDDLSDIHRRMQEELQQNFGVQFDDIIVCTDATDDSLRRKPSPAMIFEAREKFDIDLKNSWFVGDSPSDIEAGTRAGTKTAFLKNGHEEVPPNATIIVDSLRDLAGYLS